MSEDTSTPRFSITVKGGNDSTSSGVLSSLFLGFGIHQTWIYALMFGGFSIFNAPGTELSDSYSAYILIISILVFGVSLLFCAATDQRFLHYFVSRKLMVAAGIITSIGTLMALGAHAGADAGVALMWASGILTGIGSCLLLLFWGVAFARTSPETIILNTAFALLLAVTLYTLILHWLPYPASSICTALLPLLELGLLYRHTPVPYYLRHHVPVFSPLPIKRGVFSLRVGVPVLFFGVALGTLRTTSLSVIMPSTDLQSQMLVWLGAGVATLIIAGVMFTTQHDGHWDLLFRTLLPLIAASVVVLALLGLTSSPVGMLIVVVGYLCFEALMWIFFGEVVQCFRISPVFTYGLGRGLLALGSTLTTIILVFAKDFVPMLSPDLRTQALVILACMFIAYALLPRQREIAHLIKQTNSAAHEKEITKLNDKVDAAEQAKQQKLEKAPSFTPAAVALEITNQTSTESAPNLDETKTPADADLPQKRSGWFRTVCETIANRYLLSTRELEVLYLLAKGHNASYIQEKLYVSKSTAKTHISHIYRKLDIHSQQELLAMIEEVRAELDDRA